MTDVASPDGAGIARPERWLLGAVALAAVGVVAGIVGLVLIFGDGPAEHVAPDVVPKGVSRATSVGSAKPLVLVTRPSAQPERRPPAPAKPKPAPRVEPTQPASPPVVTVPDVPATPDPTVPDVPE